MCRRFLLVRDEFDGVNQPGKVAEGVVFASGKVALSWIQPPHSIQTFDAIADVLMVQKANSVTRLVWTDGRDERPETVSRAARPRLVEAQETLAGMLGGDHVLVSPASSRSVKMDYAQDISDSTVTLKNLTEP